MAINIKTTLDTAKIKEELTNAVKKTGAFDEFSGASGDPNKVRLTKGGTPRDWQALSDDERWEVFDQAGLSNTWLNVSFQTPRAFGDVIDNTQALVDGYKTALEAGKTLMYANRTLALATLNPAVFALEQLIELAKSTIDDIMGSGLYFLVVNSQDLNEKDHKVKSRNYNLEFNRFNLSGLSINPFTNNLFFHVQPIEDINLLAAKSRQYKQTVTSLGDIQFLQHDPYAPRVRYYKDNPNKYLIYNGKVFDRQTRKPVLINAAKHYNIPSDLMKFVTSPFQNWKVCPPKKMLQIMNNSFDDKLDMDRPISSDSARVGALIMIAGTTDPTKIAAKVVKLYNYFAGGGPLTRAANVFLNAMNTTYKYRTEEIVVENLCAPNNFNNPAEKDWPFIVGEDSEILSARDEWRVGHNSDNYQRYGSGILEYNKDKVILKNLRTKEIMQIISVGEPEKIEVPSTRGPDVVMTDEGQIVHSENAGADPELPVGTFSTDEIYQGLDIFNSESQSKKVRYRQKIIVQHQDFIIGTSPGDVLVEVEVSGFRNLNKDGTTSSSLDSMVNTGLSAIGLGDDDFNQFEQITEPDNNRPSSDGSYSNIDTELTNDDTDGLYGFWTNFQRVPVFTLKNGTPNFLEDEVEKIFRTILLDRLMAERLVDQSKMIKAYFHYSDKINSNPLEYRTDLTYFSEVDADEADQYLKGVSFWNNLTVLGGEETLGENLNTYPINQEEASLWLEIMALDEIINRQSTTLIEDDIRGGSQYGLESANRRQVADLQTKIDQLNKKINDKDNEITKFTTISQTLESDITNYNSLRDEIQGSGSFRTNDITYSEIENYSADIGKMVLGFEETMAAKETIMTKLYNNAMKSYVEKYKDQVMLDLDQKAYRERTGFLDGVGYQRPAEFSNEIESAAIAELEVSFGRSSERENQIIINFEGMTPYYPTVLEEWRTARNSRREAISNHEEKIKLQEQIFDSGKPFAERLNAIGLPPTISLKDTLDQLTNFIEEKKEDLKENESTKSRIEIERSKLIEERNDLTIHRTTILSASTFDDIESSLTSLERRRNEKYLQLSNLIKNRSPFPSWNSNTFTIEKVASGRFQRKRAGSSSGTLIPGLNYDFSEDDLADYEVVVDQNDNQALDKFNNLLNTLVLRDTDNIAGIKWSNYDTYNLELTDVETEKAIKLFFSNSSLDFDPNTFSGDMKNFFENMLDQHLYLPRYKGTGIPLSAPRYCNVLTNKPLEEDLPKVTNETEGMYPDWNNKTLEEILPGFRDVLNLVVTLLEATKGAVEDIITVIDDIIEFIEKEIIPQLEEIIDIIQEFIDILKIGIIDAGIWFLYVPAEAGGVKRIRQAMKNATNPPPENIDFTFGMMLLTQQYAGEESVKKDAFEIVTPLLGLS